MHKWSTKDSTIKITQRIIDKIRYLCLGKKTVRSLIILSLLALLSLTMAPYRLIAVKYPQEGEFSQKTIKSPYDFTCKDIDATIIKQKQAAASVKPIYILDLTIIPSVMEKVTRLFNHIEEIREKKNLKLEEAVKRVKEEFKEIQLSDETIEMLLIHPQLFELQTDVTAILRTCLGYGLTQTSPDRFKADLQKGINLNIISEETTSEKIITSEDNFFFMPTLPVSSHLYPVLHSTSKSKQAVFEIANQLMQPNLIFDLKKTDKAVKEAIKQVEPVMIKISQGEKIVGDGERVDRIAVMKLQQLSRHRATTNINITLGSLILLYVLLAITLIYLYRYHPNIFGLNKNLILVGLLIAIIIGITRGISSINWPLYTIPVSSVSMLLAILLNQPIAIFVTFFISILIGIMLGGNITFTIIFCCGGFASIYFITSARIRGDIIKPGLAVSLAQAMAIIGSGLSHQETLLVIGTNLFWGSLVNGLASTIMTMGVLPYLENIFNMTTNFRLFELSDLNAPLLKSLLLKAPGTYHHSLLVANLAEVSAESIGANPLLARVGAYYHDIGKMSRAEYFAENQLGKSRHDSIKTSLSVSVLKSHVKEGVEMAKRYNLPQRVTEIIQQHHGDSLMTYFYHQAKQENQDEEPNKLDFSYPGPKPQTKEAAIIMLADAVEAASRSLAKPTPVRIEGLVKKIINNKFIDGELDDCDLTLMSLNKIAQVFIRTLSTLFHSRVEYPKTEEGKMAEEELIEDEIAG